MFKCALQTITELTELRDLHRSSATAAHKYILYINNAPSRRDRPHNIGITTLLFMMNVQWVEGRETGPTV